MAADPTRPGPASRRSGRGGLPESPLSLGLGDASLARFLLECPDPVAVTRLADGRLVEANQAFLELTGLRRAEAVGRTEEELGGRGLAVARGAVRNRAAAAGVLLEVPDRAGLPRLLEASVQRVVLGGEECVVTVGRDVTERRGGEDDRRRTHEMVVATIESTADGILVVDNEGRTVHANRRFADMWQIPEDLLATRSDERLLAFVLDQLVDPDAFLAKVHELYRTDREDLDELHFKDGRVFERYSRPLVHEGRLAGRVWSFRDVTEERRGAEAIREAEARFRALVEQIPAVTYIEALEGAATILYISPQVEGLLGHSPAEFLADPDLMRTLVHPEDREAWLAQSARSDETGEPFRMEYRLLRRDGQVVWVRDEEVLVRDEEGRPRFWQGVMFDITERREAQDRLARAWHRELEAGRRLRALDEMKNTFLQAVSHELRTPLTTILGMALTLARDDVDLAPEEARELARRLAANARKLNRLLADLLDLDRLSRGIVEPKRQPTDLAALVGRILEETDLLDGRSVTVEAEPVVVAVEPSKVERIVENLLANATRHTPEEARVWIRVEARDGGGLIAVEDEGPGVPPEARERIFEPFQQLSASQSPAPGVGIGLSLVARFAEIHGGRAWVEDRPGGGSSFRVFLPEAGVSPAREA